MHQACNMKGQEHAPPTMAFDTLPIELNQAIAHELDDDKDIATFRLICRGTNDAIDADMGSYWRAKFRAKFALRNGVTNEKLKELYQTRTKWLKRGTGYEFFRGHRSREKEVMKVLRGLILDSFQGAVEIDEHGRPHCKNQAVLRKFVLDSKLLLQTTRAPPPAVARNEPNEVNRLLAAIKLICSHFVFELDDAHVFAIEESQQVVYMSTNDAPLYGGANFTDVNMTWMLHCMQFFRNHMMNEDVASLHQAMEELSPCQKPSAWQEPITRTGTYPLSKHWKGTYSFLDITEVAKIRKLSPDELGDTYFCDKNVDEGKIQSLVLDFDQQPEIKWPQIFEKRLNSRRSAEEPLLTTQGRSKPKVATHNITKDIRFIGTGVDLDDDFHCIGWLNALPVQHGIPGWQRITFMKHFMDDFEQEEQDNLWAYEGVVLPGGRIILGRWWYASESVDFNDYNGPFILWAVDEPELEDEDVDDEDV